MEVTAHDLVVALSAWFKGRRVRYLREAKSLRKCKNPGRKRGVNERAIVMAELQGICTMWRNNPDVLAEFIRTHGSKGLKVMPKDIKPTIPTPPVLGIMVGNPKGITKLKFE